MTVVRGRKIQTALRTNWIAELITVPSWKKIIIALYYATKYSLCSFQKISILLPQSSVQIDPSHPARNSSCGSYFCFWDLPPHWKVHFTIKNCIVLQADEAFHIGAAASRESYLKMEKIIEVAIQSGAQVMNKLK